MESRGRKLARIAAELYQSHELSDSSGEQEYVILSLDGPVEERRFLKAVPTLQNGLEIDTNCDMGERLNSLTDQSLFLCETAENELYIDNLDKTSDEDTERSGFENRNDSDNKRMQENEEDNTEEDKQISHPKPKYYKKEYATLRLQGKKYTGFKRQGSICMEVERNERKILPKKCSHRIKCKPSERSYHCEEISEVARKNVHETVWNFGTWDEKKAYIKGLVNFRKPLRRRASTDESTSPRKKYAYDCFLPTADGVKVRVCRDLFLSTTAIKKDVFNAWIRTSCGTTSEEQSGTQKRRNEDETRENKKRMKTDTALQWLNTIPKVPSHYCRSSSTRIYVDESFRSLSHMHTVYKQWCEENKVVAVQRKAFSEVLHNNKISIFKPRKDQCDVCVSFKEGNCSEVEYNAHIVKKDEAREAKKLAVSEASEDTLVVTMDVQSVLSCPKLLVSKQYYTQKLQIHNFTIYVSNNKDVHMYVWHEGDGKVTANEFTSCIVDFIKKNMQYKKIILISDGCSYQNRNKTLASALSDISMKTNNIEIEQIILEKGHTMMEVDSVHSTLERHFKPPIYTPAHYIMKMGEARRNHPYIVHQLDYSFFKNYENLPNNYKSIRPGRNSGDPTVADLRALKYSKGEVLYKIRQSQRWEPLPQRRNKHNEMEPTQLYQKPLRIEKKKLESLQSLKPFMLNEHQLFYDSLKN